MYHFFVNRSQIGEKQIRILDQDVNHIKNVLRMKSGEEILIGNGEGDDYFCKITEIGEDMILCDIVSVDESDRELPAKIYLFQGLPKSDKMELIIQKAVELGVYEIIPVNTKRVIVKLDSKKEENKIKRWNTIAESAAKQSKRSLIPKVTGVLSFKEALDYAGKLDYNLIPYEHAVNMQETKEHIGKVKGMQSIGIFIGPEGGFDEKEIEMAFEKEVYPITLGKRILRTETAGLAVLSVLMFYLEG